MNKIVDRELAERLARQLQAGDGDAVEIVGDSGAVGYFISAESYETLHESRDEPLTDEERKLGEEIIEGIRQAGRGELIEWTPDFLYDRLKQRHPEKFKLMFPDRA